MSRFRVVASSLRIRQQPSTHSEILGSLPRNVIVEPLDLSLDEKWFFVQVDLAGSRVEGWVFKDFLVPDDSSPEDATPAGPRWLEIAAREIGVEEVPGPGDNPRVIEYHQATTLKATDDSVAWCSSFVNWCMKQAGIQGTRSAAARSWLNWGKKLDSPRNGCVVVLKRGNNPNNGHVAFYVGDGSGDIRLLGGNQSDQVKVSAFPKTMVLSYRWPS
ncbi:MAG TPA: TIGR02594 family protein [Blastocatellia bacterium]|nr:TIGR02594 family protein [Blastocatellia bacterium]